MSECESEAGEHHTENAANKADKRSCGDMLACPIAVDLSPGVEQQTLVVQRAVAGFVWQVALLLGVLFIEYSPFRYDATFTVIAGGLLLAKFLSGINRSGWVSVFGHHRLADVVRYALGRHPIAVVRIVFATSLMLAILVLQVYLAVDLWNMGKRDSFVAALVALLLPGTLRTHYRNV